MPLVAEFPHPAEIRPRPRLYRLVRYLSGLLLGAAALMPGCFEDAGGAAAPSSKTLIAVAPSDFLGKVPCVEADGAMRVYVATAYDITELEGGPSDPIVLPSSPPTVCHQTVAFGLVAPLHQYAIRIEGYDTSDVHPLDRGSAVMLDSQGRFVAPRWTSLCSGPRATAAEAGEDSGGEAATPDAGDLPDVTVDGDLPDVAVDGDSPDAPVDAAADDAGPSSSGPSCSVDPLSARGRGVTAFRTVTRLASVCTPICDRGPATPTGMVVGISDALGGQSCGDQPGQVSTFNVIPESSGLSPQNNVACSSEARFEQGIVPGTSYGFSVTAFEAGASSPRWGTHCAGVALAGAIVRARCDPLSSTGALEIDVKALLSQAGLSCADVARISAALSGEAGTTAQISTPPSCPAMRFSNLSIGLHIADVSIERGEAGAPRTARCEGLVAPATSTAASCLLLSGSP